MMKANRTNPVSKSNWLFVGLGFTTLYFNSKIQDPFNSPKFWAILILAAWATGHIVTNLKELFVNREQKIIFFTSIIFILSMFVAALATDDKYTGFFGENLRRNGFLTYFALTLIFLFTVLKSDKSSLNCLLVTSLIVGFLVGAYGVIQTFGYDFIQWNNPYNSVIATLGNPNFAAALMAILGVLNLSAIFQNTLSKPIKVLFMLNYFLLIFAIYRSDARQGLISLFVGTAVLIGYVILNWKRIVAKVYFSLLSLILFIGLLGMLQIGPLTSLFYKPSISVRGFYWRAGLEMFLDNPIFGIGIDRFGAYFKEYREPEYSLNYGYDLTSTNAHNTPIQLFATGGFLVGASYLLLLFLVLFFSLRHLKNISGSERLVFAGVFSAWIAFQSQSMVSIDNIGLSIWGWILSGFLIALTKKQKLDNSLLQKRRSSTSLNNRDLIKLLVSSTMVLASVVLISLLYRGESNMFQTRLRYNPQSETNAAPLREYAEKTIGTPLIEPYYEFMSAGYLVTSGFVKEGMDELLKLYQQDPRNLDVLRSLGEFTLQQGNASESVKYFEKISELDPWNAANYLTLGRIYLNLGDFEKMEAMKSKIDSFAPNSEQANQAEIELVS
jgi:O-antigen ligase